MSRGHRILRLHDGSISVAHEAHFEAEEELHRAVAAHPEVLPNEDFGLGPLAPLANELDLGAGPMDLLAADAEGRLAIIEFKRGTENPDIRQVVAQLLDYGAALWRYGYDDLEEQCRRLSPGFAGPLAEHVADSLRPLGEQVDVDAFHTGVQQSLEAGNFAFLYCGRDLDERSRRIMTYLAEGPRMSFFAVEVDYFRGAAGEAILVPRAAFVPSWVGQQTFPSERGARRVNLAEAPAEFHEMVERMDEVREQMGLQVRRSRSGWNYLPPILEGEGPYPNSGIGVYATGRGVEFNLAILRSRGQEEFADHLLERLEAITGSSAARNWPSVACASLLADWPRVRAEIVEPYFRARMAPTQE